MLTDKLDAARAALAQSLEEWDATKEHRTDQAINHLLADIDAVDRCADELRTQLLREALRRRQMTDIHTILGGCTEMYRKGEAVIEHPAEGGVQVTEVFAMDHESSVPKHFEVVDMHFIKVGVDKVAAELQRNDFEAWCEEYPRLAEGPSYIELGGYLGSQDAALRLMALGQVLGYWKVITPELLGLTGEAADHAAGAGYVMTTGYKKLPQHA